MKKLFIVLLYTVYCSHTGADPVTFLKKELITLFNLQLEITKPRPEHKEQNNKVQTENKL